MSHAQKFSGPIHTSGFTPAEVLLRRESSIATSSCVELRVLYVALLAAPYTHTTMEDAATVICVLLVLVGVGSGLYILKRAAEVEQHDAALSRKIEELEARNATHLARRNSPHADFLRAMIPDDVVLERINERMLRRPSQDDLKLLS